MGKLSQESIKKMWQMILLTTFEAQQRVDESRKLKKILNYIKANNT